MKFMPVEHLGFLLMGAWGTVQLSALAFIGGGLIGLALALALADAFECGVNDLPLTLVLSWFEQKAIVILLTLLALGVKDIRTGPTAPAFLTPALLKVLEEQFGLKGTTTADADLAEILAA